MPLIMEISAVTLSRMTYVDLIKKRKEKYIELVMIVAYKMKQQPHDPLLSFN